MDKTVRGSEVSVMGRRDLPEVGYPVDVCTSLAAQDVARLQCTRGSYHETHHPNR
jgi:hypothetical protein